MPSLRWLLSLILMVFALPAWADTVRLTNGRVIEGRVVAQGAGMIRIEVAGGFVQFPLGSVKSVIRKRRPEERVAAALMGIDREDPEALEAVALQAEGLGMLDVAAELEALARGLRLEHKLAALAKSEAPDDFLILERWAERAGCGFGERRYLLERALAIDPGSEAALGALASLEQAERAVARKRYAAERAEFSRAREAEARRASAKKTRSVPSRRSRKRASDCVSLKNLRSRLKAELARLERERVALAGARRRLAEERRRRRASRRSASRQRRRRR